MRLPWNRWLHRHRDTDRAFLPPWILYRCSCGAVRARMLPGGTWSTLPEGYPYPASGKRDSGWVTTEERQEK